MTATQVNLAFYGSGDGPVSNFCSENATAELLCDWQSWINSRYQLFGRTLRMYYVQTGDTAADAESSAVLAKSVDNSFLAWDSGQINGALTPASVGQRLVTWTDYRTDSFYSASAPYAWSWFPSDDQDLAFGGALVCKQLAGKPPSFNQHMDPTFDYNKPRVFGAVVLEQNGGTANETLMDQALAACGVHPKVTVSYNYGSEASNLSYVITSMKANGVTTILEFGDGAATNILTSAATQQDYYPEWVEYANSHMSNNSVGQGTDQTQFDHAISFNFDEIPRPLSEQDWYIAACEVDPNCQNTASAGVGASSYAIRDDFNTLVEIANGLQLAGPHLTPQTYQQGLHTLDRPPDPIWSVGGSFQSPDPWTFGKWASLTWWNPNAVDPVSGIQGAWEFLNDGERYTIATIPSVPQGFFQAGGSITTAPSSN